MDKVERLERECEIRFESEIQLCKEIDAKNDRIAALESQLADRHAERVREIDAHTERVAGLESQLATERAARESAEQQRDEARARARTEGIERAEAVAARIEAEQLAVWAVRQGVELELSPLQSGVNMVVAGVCRFPVDETSDAGILAALRRAAKGGGGS